MVWNELKWSEVCLIHGEIRKLVSKTKEVCQVPVSFIKILNHSNVMLFQKKQKKRKKKKGKELLSVLLWALGELSMIWFTIHFQCLSFCIVTVLIIYQFKKSNRLAEIYHYNHKQRRAILRQVTRFYNILKSLVSFW